MIFAFLVMLLFSNSYFQIPNFYTILLIISVGFVVSLSRKFVLQALSHLSSSVYFILVRVFSSLFIIFFSMIFLGEYLTVFQWIGIFFGIGVFLLLYHNKDKVKKNSNLKLDFLFLLLTVLEFSYVNPIHKLIMFELDTFTYLFYFMLSTFLWSSFLFLPKVKGEVFQRKHKKIFYLAGLSSFLLIISISFLFKAYLLQDVAVVYKIFSFELFIPIILSIIFYKEKITFRKTLAFIGTILTILFFI